MKVQLKRLFDILCSGIIFLVCTPLLLFAAAWIRLDSKGPVVFKQERIGENKKPFQVLKLRTMINRASATIDQNNEQVIIDGKDPRITRSGRFLRGTSLDELPQLWNIIRGDMSLVGPRPIIPEQLEVVPREFERRFEVLPGLTGLAQIKGRRSLGWLEQLEFDVEYVCKCSFFYDLYIILKTVVVVMTGSGVYSKEAENWRAYRDRTKVQDSLDDRGN